VSGDDRAGVPGDLRGDRGHRPRPGHHPGRPLRHRAALGRGQGDPVADRRRAEHRGAELPRFRRDLHAVRGGHRRPEGRGHRDGQRAAHRGRAVHRPDLLAAALAAGTDSFPEDQVGNAFFDLVGQASSEGWAKAFLAVNALAVGIANAIAAQAATSRLLFSMSRDRQLPSFLRRVNRRQIPQNALLLVSGLTLVLVLFFVGRLGLISSLVNFGALFGFCLLHVSVVNHYVIRKRSRNYLLHLVVPLIGFGIIGYVLTQADTNAKVGGVIWLAVGALVFLYFLLTGRSRELTIGEGA
jgi:amino acid transporter